MKTNLVKQKILRGEPAFGYSAKLGAPVVAELMNAAIANGGAELDHSALVTMLETLGNFEIPKAG